MLFNLLVASPVEVPGTFMNTSRSNLIHGNSCGRLSLLVMSNIFNEGLARKLARDPLRNHPV